MPDGDVAGHGGQGLLVEHLGHQAEVFEHQNLRAVGDRDTRGLLAPVLQGVEAVVAELGDFLTGGPDAEDAALFPRGVLKIFQLTGHCVGCSLPDR